jgi:trk system potassium uptake protein TrkA
VSHLHARVLRAVGAHEVLNPEEEMGRRLARRLGQPNVLERLELGEGVDVAEIEAPESWVGRSLVELDVRRSYGISVVAIRRAGRIEATLHGGERLASRDVLVVIGTAASIARLAALA